LWPNYPGNRGSTQEEEEEPLATATHDRLNVLALVTLGGVTQIGLSLFRVKPPKVAKANKTMA